MRVTTADQVAALGEWLLRLGSEIDKTPVGLAIGPYEIALATQERGWLLPWDTPAQPITAATLRTLLLSERTGPALVVPNILAVAGGLERLLGEDYDRASLLHNTVHEMYALEYATGRPVRRIGEESPLKIALDAATVGPMLALEAPRFYKEVGMPLARYVARKVHTIPTYGPEWHRWTVIYDWLFFRILAYFTHDPTFIRWFEEGKSPLHELATCLELEPEPTVAFILWLCCGEDEVFLGEKYPLWAAKLPENPQLVKAARADKQVPTLRLGLLRLFEQAQAARRVQTLYGRRSPWGLRPQELLHFQLLGSVNDILDVVIVSLINMGSEAHWLLRESESPYSHWLRAQLVGYTKREPMEWQQKLEELTPLANPLGVVALQPKVTVE